MNKSLSLILYKIPFLKKVIYNGQHSIAEHDYAAQKLKEFYTDCVLKLSHDSEFLFFAGIMMYIRDWYLVKKLTLSEMLLFQEQAQLEWLRSKRLL